MGGRSVFISYRRQLSWSLARLVRDYLTKHQFDTFMDVDNLDSGEFPRAILSEIEAREHFIVLLQPGSLDHIGESGDWLRREIAHALAHGRNVVPVTAGEFRFRRDLVLPSDVERLASCTAVDIPPEYFDSAMEKLRTRFLKTPSKPPAPQAETLSDQRPGAKQEPTRPWAPKSTSKPVAPQLSGRWHGSQVELTWSEVPGADLYLLERTVGSRPFLGRDSRHQEVYRGPDRSYNDDLAPDQAEESGFLRYLDRLPSDDLTPDQAEESGFLRYLDRLPSMVSYRVWARVPGQAGRWSDTLQLDRP